MPLELRKVTHEHEFDAIVRCECESYAEPLNTFFRLFRYDESPAGFIELRDRQIREWKADGTSEWWIVVDTELGDQVIAAAKWNTFLENPYPEGGECAYPVEEAEWWPEGEDREFANRVYDSFLRQRRVKMARPHLLLAMLFTHPAHRLRGAARLLLTHGTQRADTLGLETFIEATTDGKPCYEALGFTFMGTHHWESARPKPSRRWRELERFLGMPVVTFLMWRPVGGVEVEGAGVVRLGEGGVGGG